MRIETIIPLGTGGWIPNQHRQTTCIAVLSSDRLILLDAGSGISRFFEADMQRLLSRYNEVCIFLSHFHFDHIIGLTYAPLFFKGKRVSIYGPGPSCSGHRTEDALRRALSSPFFSLSLDRFPMDLSVHDLVPGSNDIADGFTLTTRVQEHSDPSIGMKINKDSLAFVTDTGCDDETVSFVSGCRILFHDAYYDRRDYEQLLASPSGKTDLRDHGHVQGVAEIAKKAEVGRAYLIHMSPEYREDRLREMENDARTIYSAITIPDDLDRIEP